MEKAAAVIKENAKTIRQIRRTKTTLSSPFDIQWPSIENPVNQEILEKLKRNLKALQPYIAKVKVKYRLGKKEVTMETSETSEQKLRKKSIRSKSHTRQNMKEEPATLSSHILFGVNVITRSMETGDLDLVLVNKPAENLDVLTDHLKLLSATRRIPAACLRGLNDMLSEVVHIRTILAVGFKKMKSSCQISEEVCNDYNRMIDEVTSMVSPVEVPWLTKKEDGLMSAAKGLVKTLFSSKEDNISQDVSKSKNKGSPNVNNLGKSELLKGPVEKREYSSGVSEYGGKKRKHEEGEAVAKKVKVGQNSSLQPLNLRHVVHGNKKSWNGKKKRKNRKARMQNIPDKYKFS